MLPLDRLDRSPMRRRDRYCWCRRCGERSIAMSEANSGLTGRVVDGFTNILSVKLFAHAEREEAFGREAFERQLEAARAMNRAIMTMTAALTILNSLFIFAVAALSIWLWTAGRDHARRDRRRQRAGAPAEPDVGLDPALDHHRSSRASARSRTAWPPIARPNDDARPARRRRRSSWRDGAIAFENVTFRYGEGERVIDDLSLSIRPGREGGAGRPVGRRQVDARQPAPALLRARGGAHPDRRAGHRRRHAGIAPRGDRHGDAGHLAAAPLGARQHQLRPPGSRRSGDRARPRRRRAPTASSPGWSIRAGGATTRRMSASAASSSRAASASASPSPASS